jgi:hypothetical protein
MLEQCPLFQNVSRLALIPSESISSGHKPGLVGEAKFVVCLTIYERFLGGGKKSPRIRFRLDIRRFSILESSTHDFMRRENRSLRPPIFPGTIPVWQRQSARQAIQAQSWLGSDWKDGDGSERISGGSLEAFRNRNQG